MTRLCIETGGTAIRVAIHDSDKNGGKPDQFEKYPNTTFEEVLQQVIEYSKKHAPIHEIGIASFGPICLDRTHTDYGKLLSVPSEAKASWKDKSLTVEVAKALNIPLEKTYLNTDVTGSAIGELIYGNHLVKSGTLVYITVGTGVGVGAVVDGKPIKGRLHPEGGHCLVLTDERDTKLFPDFKGACNFHRNCVENMITNYAISERYNISIHDLHTISDEEPIWDIISNYLGQLCLSITYLMSPHCIVIGGGILSRKQILPAVRKYFNEYNKDYVKITDLDGYIQETNVEHNAILGAAVLNN